MQQDFSSIQGHLQDLEDRIGECKAACELASEGDPSAIGELHRQIEAMAAAIAELKQAASSAPL